MEIVGWILFTLGTCCFCVGLLYALYEINATALFLICIGIVGVGIGYVFLCLAADEKKQSNVPKAETLIIEDTKATFSNNSNELLIIN